jgi:ABC-2 type transport system ATP-binding protein
LALRRNCTPTRSDRYGAVSFSRGLFGKPKNPAHIEGAQGSVAWDRGQQDRTLSGMTRVMMPALSYEPQILFLTSRPRASTRTAQVRG